VWLLITTNPLHPEEAEGHGSEDVYKESEEEEGEDFDFNDDERIVTLLAGWQRMQECWRERSCTQLL